MGVDRQNNKNFGLHALTMKIKLSLTWHAKWREINEQEWNKKGNKKRRSNPALNL